MNKNSLPQKPENKKLVISNYRKNMVTKDSVDKKRPSLSQGHFYKKIEENIQAYRTNNTQSKEAKQKSSQLKKNQTQNNLTSKNSRTKLINLQRITNGEQSQKRNQRSISAAPLNSTKNRRHLAIFLHHSDMKQSIFNEQVQEIYNILNEQLIMQSKTSTFITLKKQKFHQIFNQMLQYIAQFNYQQMPEKPEKNLSHFTQTFSKIRDKINIIKMENKCSKMTLKHNLVFFKYSHEDYQNKIVEISQKLAELNKQNDELVKNITAKKGELQFTTVLCKQKQQLNIQLFRQQSGLMQVITGQKAKLQQIKQQIIKKQELLQSIQAKTTHILNFVEQQQDKKILHYVSQAYKQIQSDIYDYATYLQCNAMASSLNWQPKPFRAVEKWVYEEMERVNTYVLCKEESLEDKSTKMKEFITNTTRKFRTKDEEMMKVNDYKTECIKKFIKMMQKWLQNWQLKQEYLVSLRSQFAVSAEEINKLLAKLQVSQKQVENRIKPQQYDKLVLAIKKSWQKVELNYKYGNSFY